MEVQDCPLGTVRLPDNSCSAIHCPPGFELMEGSCSEDKSGSFINIKNRPIYVIFYINASYTEKTIETAENMIDRSSMFNVYSRVSRFHTKCSDINPEYNQENPCLIIKFYSSRLFDKIMIRLGPKLEFLFNYIQLRNLNDIRMKHVSVQNELPGYWCPLGLKSVIEGNMTGNFSVIQDQIRELYSEKFTFELLLTSSGLDDVNENNHETMHTVKKHLTWHKCIAALDCPWYILENTQYEFRNDTLVLTSSLRVVQKHEYWFQNGTLLICSHLIGNNNTPPMDLISLEATIQSYLTLTGQVLSMAGLFLTFITYILLPVLQTLPGKGIMNLCVSLFMSQFLLQVSSPIQPYQVLCNVIAVLQHLFWLVSFCWMSALAFNIARTFGGSSLNTGGKQSLKFYVIYAWLVPVIFVSVCVYLDISGHYLFGYGQKVCWISNIRARLYFFGIPLAVLVLINSVLFLVSVIGLYKATQAAKRVKSKKEGRKSDRDRLIAYIKLSSIMGLTWIFGFLANINAHLWYLFIVLNASQGVFIFISFVCSRRVVGMIGKKFGLACLKPSEHTTTTSTTGVTNGILDAATKTPEFDKKNKI